MIRTVLIHGGEHLLPELGKELGCYAERKLRQRGVEVVTGALVSGYDGSVVQAETTAHLFRAATLIWTAGAKLH